MQSNQTVLCHMVDSACTTQKRGGKATAHTRCDRAACTDESTPLCCSQMFTSMSRAAPLLMRWSVLCSTSALAGANASVDKSSGADWNRDLNTSGTGANRTSHSRIPNKVDHTPLSLCTPAQLPCSGRAKCSNARSSTVTCECPSCDINLHNIPPATATDTESCSTLCATHGQPKNPQEKSSLSYSHNEDTTVVRSSEHLQSHSDVLLALCGNATNRVWEHAPIPHPKPCANTRNNGCGLNMKDAWLPQCL